jgi:hypothetical protein
MALQPYNPAPLVKPWWQSRTLIGVAVLLISQALKAANVDIVDAEVTDALTLLLDTVGASLAIYGRIKARRTLKFTSPGGAFNPRAEVRKARRNRESGRAGLSAVALLFLTFLVVGGTTAGVNLLAGEYRVARYADAEGATRPSISAVRVEDRRPFLLRLLASVRLTPSLAVAYTEDGTVVRLRKIELVGGTEF